MRSTIVILLAACLAGCNKSGGNAATQGAAAAPAGPVTMADIPRPKAGLWEASAEMTVDGKDFMGGPSGMTLPKTQVCVDQTYDANKTWREKMSQMTAQCGSEPELTRRADGTISMHLTCTPKTGKPLTVDGVISGDYASATKVDMTLSTSDESGTPHTMHMVMSQTRVGDCLPGQKGGDMSINGKPFVMPTPPAQ